MHGLWQGSFVYEGCWALWWYILSLVRRRRRTSTEFLLKQGSLNLMFIHLLGVAVSLRDCLMVKAFCLQSGRATISLASCSLCRARENRTWVWTAFSCSHCFHRLFFSHVFWKLKGGLVAESFVRYHTVLLGWAAFLAFKWDCCEHRRYLFRESCGQFGRNRLIRAASPCKNWLRSAPRVLDQCCWR